MSNELPKHIFVGIGTGVTYRKKWDTEPFDKSTPYVALSVYEANIKKIQGLIDAAVQQQTRDSTEFHNLKAKLESAEASIRLLTQELQKKEGEFHQGVKAFFDYLLFRAANNYHGDPETDKVCQEENRVVRGWAEDGLREVDKDSYEEWNALTDVMNQNLRTLSALEACNRENIELRKRSSPTKTQVSEELLPYTQVGVIKGSVRFTGRSQFEDGETFLHDNTSFIDPTAFLYGSTGSIFLSWCKRQIDKVFVRVPK